MTFAEPEHAVTGDGSEALEAARVRLAESGELADRAIRYHLAEAVCAELAGIRRELATLRADLRQPAS